MHHHICAFVYNIDYIRYNFLVAAAILSLPYSKLDSRALASINSILEETKTQIIFCSWTHSKTRLHIKRITSLP